MSVARAVIARDRATACRERSPEQKAKGLEPEKMETIIPALESRIRENLKARQVAEWLRNIRNQAEVRINKDCLDSAKENTP